MNNNFINSLVNDQSKVGQYLAAAEVELSNMKLGELSGQLKNIQNTFNEVVKLEKNVKTSINVIYQRRDELFSNLMTTMIANFYCRKISEKLAEYQTRLVATNYLNESSDTLDDILTDMSTSLSAYASTLSIASNSSTSYNDINAVITSAQTSPIISTENTASTPEITDSECKEVASISALPSEKENGTVGSVIEKDENGKDIIVYYVKTVDGWEKVSNVGDAGSSVSEKDVISSIDNAQNYSPLNLTDSVADSFNNQLDKLKDIFDKIKEPLGFPEAECTENGVKGLENIYTVSGSDIMSGTIRFIKKSEDLTRDYKLENTENIFNGKIDEKDGAIYYEKDSKKYPLFAEVSLKTKKDYMLEDGTEENPFIITSKKDAISKGMFKRNVDLELHYVLANDITINFSPTFDGTLHLNRTIKPNGHTITCGVLISKIDFGGQLKDGYLNIIMTAKMGPRPLFFPLLVRYYDLNIKFGNGAALDDNSKLDIYARLLGGNLLISSLFKVTTHGIGLKKRFKPTEDEGDGETSKINFHYLSDVVGAKGISWTFKEDPFYGNKLEDEDVEKVNPIVGSEAPAAKGRDVISNISIPKDTEVSFKGPVTYDKYINRYVITGDDTASSIRYLPSYKGGLSTIYGNFSKVVYEKTDIEKGTYKSYRLFGLEKNRACKRLSDKNLNDEELDPALQTLVDIGELNKLKNDLPALQGKAPKKAISPDENESPDSETSIESITSNLEITPDKIVSALPIKNTYTGEWIDPISNEVLPENSNDIPKIDQIFQIENESEETPKEYFRFDGTSWVSVSPEMSGTSEAKETTTNSNNETILSISDRLEMIVSYLNIIADLKASTTGLSISLESQEKANAQSMYNSIESFKFIETNRKSNDSYFNDEYTKDINTAFEKLNGYTGQILLNGGQDTQSAINTLSIFNTINTEIIKIQNMINDILLGLIPSIIKLNKVIDTKCAFFTNYFEYDLSLNKSIKILDNAVFTLNSSDYSTLGFSPVLIRAIRGFEQEWLEYMSPVIADGDHGFLQLYIGYEYGLNLLSKADVNDNVLSAVLFKSLINDILLKLYKKKLINEEYLRKEIIYDRETVLKNEYNLDVSADAQFETISQRLISIIPDLQQFSYIDIFPILTALSVPDIEKIEKIKHFLDIAILSYIFSQKIDQNLSGKILYNRIKNLNDIFLEVDLNFKTLYIKYRLNEILKKILENIENSILNDYAYELKEIIDNDLEWKINEYVSIWTFKYYTEFKTTELVTPFIIDKENNDISEYLRNASFVDSQEDRLSKLNEELIVEFTPQVWNQMASLII